MKLQTGSSHVVNPVVVLMCSVPSASVVIVSLLTSMRQNWIYEYDILCITILVKYD